MLQDSVVRIEKYIDTSTSNDKTGHINNHTVASEFTKPMMIINVPHKPDNVDSVSVSDSCDKQRTNKNTSVITKPTNENDMLVSESIFTDRMSHDNRNLDEFASDNTTARQLFKPLPDINIEQNINDSSESLQAFEPLDDIDIENNTDDSSEMLIQDQPNPYNNVTTLFNLNSTDTNCVHQSEPNVCTWLVSQ